MDILEHYTALPNNYLDHVIVIGNFDGIHPGHIALINQASDIAKKNNKKLGILTFEPHPRRLFRADDPPFRITPYMLKAQKLKQAGIDTLFSIPFDWPFASQSAESFIDNILINGLKPAHIIVGYDFCFGQLRKGKPQNIIDAGLNVTVVEKVESQNGEIYSSSAIRTALRHGDIEQANKLLGWEWEIQGTIVKGDQRGRELGYPTANIRLQETLHPAYGVYATRVKIEEDGADAPWLMAATNIGIRPMFEVPVGQLEAHILDFDRDIYGKTLRIKPIKKLRGEAKFSDLDALIAQIDQDCLETRAILENS